MDYYRLAHALTQLEFHARVGVVDPAVAVLPEHFKKNGVLRIKEELASRLIFELGLVEDAFRKYEQDHKVPVNKQACDDARTIADFLQQRDRYIEYQGDKVCLLTEAELVNWKPQLDAIIKALNDAGDVEGRS